MKVVGLEKLNNFHLGHFNWINSDGSATAGIRAETYISEVTMNLKTAFGIKDVLNKVFIKTTLDSIMLRS